jgi:hypothetical protein
MSNTMWQKMSIQEIDELYDTAIQVVLDEIVRAYKHGATFVFGVDKIKHGFRLTVNRANHGIYLLNLGAKEQPHENWPHCDAIVPDAARAGDIGLQKYTTLFYVAPEDFEQFCREADQIFNDYSIKGWCFREIPDLWFADTALIKFLREKLGPHPRLRPIFEKSPDVSRISNWAFSPKFDR